MSGTNRPPGGTTETSDRERLLSNCILSGIYFQNFKINDF